MRRSITSLSLHTMTGDIARKDFPGEDPVAEDD
jgi:hypothetical protein